MIAGILLVGIIAVTLTGCKHTDSSKKETEKPVITLGSDNYPPYNYLNEDGVPTGIDVELATEAFKRMVLKGKGAEGRVLFATARSGTETGG